MGAQHDGCPVGHQRQHLGRNLHERIVRTAPPTEPSGVGSRAPLPNVPDHADDFGFHIELFNMNVLADGVLV